MATSRRLLLDTNAFIWADVASSRLSTAARVALSSPRTTLLVSLCSVWEMQIKHALGKLPLPDRADVVARTMAESLRAEFLPITLEHIGALEALRGVHRDPFDRMIVAQAICEGAAIVSPDEVLRGYPVNVIW